MSQPKQGPERDWDYVPQLILTQEPCHRCGKTSYASTGEAKSSIKRLDRDSRKRGQRRGAMHVYQCPHGNGWHVAHRCRRVKEPERLQRGQQRWRTCVLAGRVTDEIGAYPLDHAPEVN